MRPDPGRHRRTSRGSPVSLLSEHRSIVRCFRSCGSATRPRRRPARRSAGALGSGAMAVDETTRVTHDTTEAKLRWLEELSAEAASPMGEAAAAKQHARGKLLARE